MESALQRALSLICEIPPRATEKARFCTWLFLFYFPGGTEGNHVLLFSLILDGANRQP